MHQVCGLGAVGPAVQPNCGVRLTIQVSPRDVPTGTKPADYACHSLSKSGKVAHDCTSFTACDVSFFSQGLACVFMHVLN